MQGQTWPLNVPPFYNFSESEQCWPRYPAIKPKDMKNHSAAQKQLSQPLWSENWHRELSSVKCQLSPTGL